MAGSLIYVDRRLCTRFASSGAGAARRHSIRLARHKQTGQQQSSEDDSRHALTGMTETDPGKPEF